MKMDDSCFLFEIEKMFIFVPAAVIHLTQGFSQLVPKTTDYVFTQ